VANFYLPTLSKSKKYDRISAYFTSASLGVAAKGIKSLIENGGKMRLLTSPYLSKEDVEVINKNIAQNINQVIEERLMHDLLTDEMKRSDCVEALGWLIAQKRLEIKIVLVLNEADQVIDSDTVGEDGLFHKKTGIFYDDNDNIVCFSGSVNETRRGWRSNVEEFDVYRSWKDDQLVEYIRPKIDRFEKHWNVGKGKRTLTLDFPEAVSKNWIKDIPADKDDLRIFKDNDSVIKTKGIRAPITIETRSYQKNAIENWASNGYCGLFDMATGTGKTKTALLAAERLFHEKKGELSIIITCPYLHLTNMWAEDVREFGVSPIVGHSQSPKWQDKLKKAIGLYNNRKIPFVLITTMNTFGSDFVKNRISDIKGDVLIIADEVHRFGPGGYASKLSETIKYRLGLSATIERMGDQAGTERIFSYFGEKCIQYTLDQAIKDGMLTPYRYYPVRCYYTYEEYNRMIDINEQIDKLSKSNSSADRAKIKELEINGSLLIAKMEDKIHKLIQNLHKRKDDHFIIVYCGATSIASDSDIDPETGKSGETERLITHISKKLRSSLDMELSKFTCDESNDDRRIIINDFKNKKVQAIVAIRCLDEGVNIPNIRTAFILSSSNNPREYVQRRGRVLRPAPGKEFAEIFDFIALPKNITRDKIPGENKDMELRLIARELKRVYEFYRSSSNEEDSISLINEVARKYEVLDIERYVNECK
jgi:superfamily II DNA or RNA helicase